jgi:hypothetical protein
MNWQFARDNEEKLLVYEVLDRTAFHLLLPLIVMTVTEAPFSSE